MQRFKRIIFFVPLIVTFLPPKLSEAQELIQIAIQPSEELYIYSGETMGIFSDVKNAGSFNAYQNSVINFHGERWTNRPAGRILDESANGTSGVGGYFKFHSLTNSAQFIESQNIDANTGFTNLTIANSGNVILEGSDLLLKGNLNFETGHLILNNRDAVLLPTATITGFDKEKYVVTGTRTTGGYLVRNSSGLSQADIIFPVGTDLSSYTPNTINYRGVPQKIKVRVFENVYDKGVFGIPDNVNVVPKTWNVLFTVSDPKAVLSLNTQHDASEEGSNFASNRLLTYLSRFNATKEIWDKVTPTAIGTGTITSGPTIENAFVHSRKDITGVGISEYFAKSVFKVVNNAGLRIPGGISPNNDGLNEKFVIENLKSTDMVRLDIYNRWQTLVFRDGNYKNTFDGTGNQKGLVSNELPDGTYYYVININTEKPIAGYIVINR